MRVQYCLYIWSGRGQVLRCLGPWYHTVDNDNTNFFLLQYCVKLHHLRCNKRPRTEQVCPGREAVHQQWPKRMGQSSQAGPLTPSATPSTTASLMGQTNGWHRAQSIRVHNYTHKTLASYQPQHQSPDPSKSWLLFQLFLSSLSCSSCSES